MALVTTLVATWGWMLECEGQSLVELVQELEPAVFEIHSFGEDGLPSASGTGFIIDDEGHAVTNWHVLEESAFAIGLFEDGSMAEILGVTRASEALDLAVMTLALPEGLNVKPLALENDLPPKGSELFIIGYPEGYTNFVSKGLVSAYDDSEGHTLIQSEASISGGSSGSPAFNMSGKVVGVATASDESGQNLNFLTPVSYLNELGDDYPPTALTSQLNPHYVFHERSVDNPNLILHSVVCLPEKTVAHLSYTNTSLLYGDGAYIYSNVSDERQRFKFTNLQTGEEIHVLSCTLGESPQDPTYMDLGETVLFDMVFPPLETNQTYSLTEGMAGGNWTFDNVPLLEPGLVMESTDDLEQLQTLHSMMFSKEELEYYGAGAFEYMEWMLNHEALTAYETNLAGVIAAVFENRGMAKDYFHAASIKSPLYDEPWLNLFVLTPEDNPEEELKYLDNAIRASPDSPDIHFRRAETNYNLERYAEAEADYLVFIESDRPRTGYIHEACAYSQWLQDKTYEGCVNYALALELYLMEDSPDYEYIVDMLDLMKDECGRKAAKRTRKALF